MVRYHLLSEESHEIFLKRQFFSLYISIYIISSVFLFFFFFLFSLALLEPLSFMIEAFFRYLAIFGCMLLFKRDMKKKLIEISESIGKAFQL